MKLSALRPKLLNIMVSGSLYNPKGTELATAQGIRFICPKCLRGNGGPKGVHSIVCWFEGRGVPDDEKPYGTRWGVSGTSLDDITLVPRVDTPSGGCGWRGYIINGVVTTE